ncbi:hypothetical protein [Sorangium sp. So ce145]|uniref:hypothetical protein n=1 Tax=Sorangium sp. So ce145 TaxID=3133285 RepID=UPI003F5D591A
MSAAAPPTLEEAFPRSLVRARSPVGRVLGVATMAAALAFLYAGAGLDFVLFPEEDAQPALVLEYQLRPLRTPSDTPLQILHLGAAMRGVF